MTQKTSLKRTTEVNLHVARLAFKTAFPRLEPTHSDCTEENPDHADITVGVKTLPGWDRKPVDDKISAAVRWPDGQRRHGSIELRYLLPVEVGKTEMKTEKFACWRNPRTEEVTLQRWEKPSISEECRLKYGVHWPYGKMQVLRALLPAVLFIMVTSGGLFLFGLEELRRASFAEVAILHAVSVSWGILAAMLYIKAYKDKQNRAWQEYISQLEERKNGNRPSDEAKTQ